MKKTGGFLDNANTMATNNTARTEVAPGTGLQPKISGEIFERLHAFIYDTDVSLFCQEGIVKKSRLLIFQCVCRKKNIFAQLADAHRMIAYHPEWGQFTGSVTATILLQQINFRWDQNGQKQFYKFREPCPNAYYKTGDSWIEELGFGVYEFDAAIKKIGQKVSAARRAKQPNLDQHDKPVEYWIDESHRTWYRIHAQNFLKLLATIYDISPLETDAPPEQSPKLPEKTPEALPNKATTPYQDVVRDAENARPVPDWVFPNQEIGKNPKRSDWEKPRQEIGETPNRSLKDHRQQTEKRSTTTDSDPIVVDGVEHINACLSSSGRPERITPAVLAQICGRHQTTPDAVRTAAQIMATKPDVRDVIAVLKGRRGHVSSCFLDGMCILAADEPRPAPVSSTEPPAPPSPPLVRSNTARCTPEHKQQQLEERIRALDETTRHLLLTKAMAHIAAYKNRMTPAVYQETLHQAFALEVTTYYQEVRA